MNANNITTSAKQTLGTVLISVLSIGLGGCASIAKTDSQSKAAIRDDLAMIDKTLAKVESSVPIGAKIANLHILQDSLLETAVSEGKLAHRLTILEIEANSIAELAGLEVGDELIEINEHYVPRTENAKATFEANILPDVDWSGPITFLVIRDGYARQLKWNSAKLAANKRASAPGG